jgi:hypothetical protein
VKDCKRCKEPFEGHFAAHYCDLCREIRMKKKLKKGVRKVRQCRECLKDFKPYHHAVKFCANCRVRQKRKPKEIAADTLPEYVAAVTDGGRDIIDLLNKVMKDKLYTNWKGGRGKKRQKIPVTADQMIKAAQQLRDIIWGKPSTAKAPTVQETFKPQFINVGDSTEGVGVIDVEE